ncbi:hypothetical protein IKQ26_10280 [bacterium]|nr:hypothetical protein [bacterium]
MKKILSIIIVNIFILAFMFAIYEFICFRREAKELSENFKAVNQFWKDKGVTTDDVIKAEYRLTQKLTLENLNEKLQVYEGNNPQKRPVVFIGCSFAEGLEIEPEERIPSLVAEETGRTTYNLGVAATSINWFYKRLQMEGDKSDYNNPEYFIYIYISDHIRRLFAFETLMYIENTRYKIKDDKLAEERSIINHLYSLYSIKQLARRIETSERDRELQQGYPLFNKLIEESKKVVEEKYDNPKFVLLDYPQKNNNTRLPEEEIKKLEEMGVIYLSAEDLFGHDISDDQSYWAGDNIHPSAKAWAELTPKLIKKLSL